MWAKVPVKLLSPQVAENPSPCSCKHFEVHEWISMKNTLQPKKSLWDILPDILSF
jgi:hypothetical protein